MDFVSFFVAQSMHTGFSTFEPRYLVNAIVLSSECCDFPVKGVSRGRLLARCLLTATLRVSAGSMPQGHGKNGFPFIWLMEKVLDNLHGIKGGG